MPDGKGIPLLGDRSAFNSEDYPDLHAQDIANESYTSHLPAPGADGNVLTSTGTGWASETPAATGGGHGIQDEGSDLTQRAKINFVGAGVAATDDAGNDRTLVTIARRGHSIYDEGGLQTERDGLNFVGAGVQCTDDSGNNRTIVTIPSTSFSLRVRELDGAPDVTGVTDIRLDGPTMVDNGSGTITITSQQPTGEFKNKILLMHPGTETPSEFDATYTGLLAANTAAVSGDTIILPVGSIDCSAGTNFGLKAGLTLRGWGWNSELAMAGYLIVPSNQTLQDFRINTTGAVSLAVNVDVTSGTDPATFRNMRISLDSTDSADAYAVGVVDGVPTYYNCLFEVTAAETYAAYVGYGRFFYCQGIAADGWTEDMGASGDLILYGILNDAAYSYP